MPIKCIALYLFFIVPLSQTFLPCLEQAEKLDYPITELLVYGLYRRTVGELYDRDTL